MDKCLRLSLIKKHYGFKSDAEFARFLNLTPQVVANWYRRNTFDYDILYTKCLDINANWLFSGEGSMTKEEVNKEEVKKEEIPSSLLSESIKILVETNQKQQEEITRLINLLENK
jgi:hypothetical protein